MNKIKIVQQAQLGGQEAQEALTEIFNQYHNKIYYFALNHVKSPQDAEDIVQNTFIQVFKSIDSLKDPNALQSWIYTIAHRKCLELYRKDSKLPKADIEDISQAVDVDITDDDGEFLPGNVLEDEELKSAVMEIISSLPQSQKTAILLYYYEEMDIRQIAEIEETSRGTIMSRLNYARKYIKSEVEKRRKDGDYAIAVIPLPLITMLLREMAEQNTLQPNVAEGILSGACEAVGVGGGIVATGATYTATGAGTTTTTGTTSGTTAAGAGATVTASTGISMAVKTIIGLCIVAVVGGDIYLAVALFGDDDYVDGSVYGHVGTGHEEQAQQELRQAEVDYITIRGEQYSTTLTQLNLDDMNLTDDEISPLRYMVNLGRVNIKLQCAFSAVYFTTRRR